MLSTLHTNDAPSSINRLVNMGIEPFLVANSLNLICAQRLVRRVCEHCKEPHDDVRQARLIEAGFARGRSAETCKPMKGRGCDRCSGTGYKGRVGLFEVMEIPRRCASWSSRTRTVTELRKLAIARRHVARCGRAAC